MVPAVSGSFFGQSRTAGNIYTIAGNSTGASGSAGDEGLLPVRCWLAPQGLSLDESGNLYIADTNNSRIQMVPAISGRFFGQSLSAGNMYTIAGSSTGSNGTNGDGGPATSALLGNPWG